MPPMGQPSWLRPAVPYSTTRWQGPATGTGSSLHREPWGLSLMLFQTEVSRTAAAGSAFYLEALPLPPLSRPDLCWRWGRWAGAEECRAGIRLRESASGCGVRRERWGGKVRPCRG